MNSENWKGLTPESAKKFYDSFGSKQDKQSFYEDRALEHLILRSRFNEARSVFEFGCGTGRFAETLFRHHFPSGISYTGTDISETMLQLSKKRLESFPRTTVSASLDTPLKNFPADNFDRFISNYVLDLLSEDDIRKTLSEAHRILAANGLLCLTTITRGAGFFTRIVSSGWSALFHLNPSWVGGCRPISVLTILDRSQWTIEHHEVVSQFGISSEVIVAAPRK